MGAGGGEERGLGGGVEEGSGVQHHHSRNAEQQSAPVAHPVGLLQGEKVSVKP